MKNVSYEIEQDQDAGNPRDEFDNASTFYGVSGRYIVGGKNDVEFSYRDDLEERIEELRSAGAVIHEFNTEAGDIYAVIDQETIRKEWGKGSKARKLAESCAAGEAEEFNNWARGEVYGYRVTDNATGETLDSCWGFYDYTYAEEECKSAAEHCEKQIITDKAQITKRLNKRFILAAQKNT